MTTRSAAHSMIASTYRAASRVFSLGLVPVVAALGLCVGCARPAVAGAEQVSLQCSSFCSPLDAHQLEGSRAEGAAPGAPSGTLQMSVILWDENRRIVPSSGAGSVPASPTATPMTVTPPNTTPAPVPILVH